MAGELNIEDIRPSVLRDEAPTAAASLPLQHDAVDVRVFRDWHSRHERRLSALSFLAATAAHCAVVAGLAVAIDQLDQSIAGAAGTDPAAIGIEVALVPASALEVRKQEAGAEAAQATSLHETDGAAEERLATPAEAAKLATETVPKPLIEAKPDPAPIETETSIELAEKKPEQPKPALEPLETKVPETSQPSPEPEPATPQSSGGSIAVAAIEAPPTASPPRASAAASPGAVQRYARNIVDALSRSRPKSAPGRSKGTVKLAFAIADDGSLAFVHVTSTSGNSALDDAAVQAVRSVTFPPPPPGMTLAQLTYEIPYHFR